MRYSRKVASIFCNLIPKTLSISLINTPQKVGLSCDAATASRGISSCPVTVGALFEKCRQKFESNAISEPLSSIEHILAHILGTTRISDVYKNKNKVVTREEVEKLEILCSRRLRHVPVQYVLGEWSFRQLTLKMSPPVFIPRPETEQIVDIISSEIGRKKGHFVDLCCGSGAIALALLQEHNEIKATAVDQSPAACLLTKENAQKNGLNKRIRVIQSQLERWQCEEKFDFVVSNPPYIFRDDMKTLQPEIKKYEDLEALDGGEEGLDVIKTVLDVSSRCLEAGGKLFLEVEPRHPGLLQDYLLQNTSLRLFYVETYPDFCGKSRFLQLIKK